MCKEKHWSVIQEGHFQRHDHRNARWKAVGRCDGQIEYVRVCETLMLHYNDGTNHPGCARSPSENKGSSFSRFLHSHHQCKSVCLPGVYFYSFHLALCQESLICQWLQALGWVPTSSTEHLKLLSGLTTRMRGCPEDWLFACRVLKEKQGTNCWPQLFLHGSLQMLCVHMDTAEHACTGLSRKGQPERPWVLRMGLCTIMSFPSDFIIISENM